MRESEAPWQGHAGWALLARSPAKPLFETGATVPDAFEPGFRVNPMTAWGSCSAEKLRLIEAKLLCWARELGMAPACLPLTAAHSAP